MSLRPVYRYANPPDAAIPYKPAAAAPRPWRHPPPQALTYNTRNCRPGADCPQVPDAAQAQMSVFLFQICIAHALKRFHAICAIALGQDPQPHSFQQAVGHNGTAAGLQIIGFLTAQRRQLIPESALILKSQHGIHQIDKHSFQFVILRPVFLSGLAFIQRIQQRHGIPSHRSKPEIL